MCPALIRQSPPEGTKGRKKGNRRKERERTKESEKAACECVLIETYGTSSATKAACVVIVNVGDRKVWAVIRILSGQAP